MNRRSAELPSGSPPPAKRQKQIRTHHETHLENDILPSSPYSISDDISIPKLPLEVLTHIFGFMSLRERLNASLVCKEWLEAASFSCYSRNEKLVFYGYQDFKTLLFFLLKTKRKILNLEFRNCQLSSSNFWLIADKIQYLGFINCKLSSTLLIELFVKCVNLKEYYFKENTTFSSCINGEMAKALEQLEEKHFVNENLKIFRVNCCGQTTLMVHNVQSVFKMFPNINHFTFRALDYLDAFTQEIVSQKHSLENLKIFRANSDLSLLMLHDFTRLKRISIFLPADFSETMIFDFFSRLKRLERISCRSNRGFSFPTRFFQHLMHQCSHLEHLKLKFLVSSHIDLSPEMFRTLVSSKLISLKIINLDICPTSEELFTTLINSVVNRTLRILQIPVIIDDRTQSLFIRSFKNLKILQLQCFSGTVLESIGQYQKHLAILKLSLLSRMPSYRSTCSIGPASEWRLCQAHDCLQSLTCLENLDLNFDRHAHSFDCQFVPLSVKYLSIRHPGFNMSYGSAPRQMILSLKEKTELEAIHFECNVCVDDFSFWSEICCSLNKLRFLSLCNWKSPSELPHTPDPFVEKCQTLCERCPSLRFFFNTRSAFGYDYVDRKMKVINDEHRRIEFVTTNKIADSKVKFHMMQV